MSNTPPLMAMIRIPPEMLRELLQLPQGAEILDLRAPANYRGMLEIKIIGAGWPTCEGCIIEEAVGIVTREFNGDGAELRPTIDWGFPTPK